MGSSSNIEEVRKLVDQFRRNIKQYKSPAYDEANVRVDFIDKLFELLDWDVRNVKGYSEDYRDVVREDKVVIAGKPKAPDYSFRIGGLRKFFVEAKKPAIDIKKEISPAFQVRRYAYSAKLPLSILTDFEEFSVYNTRIKPGKKDKAGTARIFYCTFDEYEKHFDFIYDTFSKPAVLKGSFDRYVGGKKGKRGTSEVDREFLKVIDGWRNELARNIALRNAKLDIYDLNNAVQKIIDRIIFLRIAEDNHMEDYGMLMAASREARVYTRLNDIFAKANIKYNSGLFQFEHWLTNLKIDNRILCSVIQGLYFPECPYEFSVLPIEILGNIYEQFLGKTIRLTPSHRAKVEDKPEVRKAGGVYYTPQYIVDYIVEHTVGEKVKGKKPEDTAKLKILDPACGSGSFLVGAFKYILDYHLKYYTKKPRLKKSLRDSNIYQVSENTFRLTIQEKQAILLNNIFGVDIDSQAVEVTKLSLLLKLMQGESIESAGSLFKHSDLTLLPDLSDNIKCGNSLIGSDYYDNQNLSLFDNGDMRKVNAFDWDKEFPAIFKQGGFDCVIGNPPYVRQEMLGEFKPYFERGYRVYHGIADLYTYFIERGISLLNKEGTFGMIVANKWMRANYGKPLRLFLKQAGLYEVIDFGDLPVFQDATTYPCIVIVRSDHGSNKFYASEVDDLSFQSLDLYLENKRFFVKKSYLNDDGWALTDEKTQNLLNKLRSQGVPLKDYVSDKIYRGILTGLNKAFVIDEKTRSRIIKKSKKCAELIKPFLAGKDIKRYGTLEVNKYLILVPKGWTREKSGNTKNAWNWFERNYPAIADHLRPYEEEGKKRYDKGEYWWELRACDYYDEFEKPKIIYPNICKRNEFAFDSKGLYTNQKCFIISLSDKYLLGILNSSVMHFIYRNALPKLRGDYYEPSYVYFKEFPIPKLSVSTRIGEAQYNKMKLLVVQMLEAQRKLGKAKTQANKKTCQKKVDLLDRQIDRLVYKLYDLTEEEIKIVEEK